MMATNTLLHTLSASTHSLTHHPPTHSPTHPLVIHLPCFSISTSNTTEYPEGTWGLKLGDMKEAIKRGHSYKDHRTELLEMAFPFERKKNTTGWPRLKGLL